MEEIQPIDPRAGENYLCQVQEPPVAGFGSWATLNK
jgi:hypothetical protein